MLSLIAIAACSPTEEGQARPEDPDGTAHGSLERSTARSSTPTGAPSVELARTNPCSLLSADELSDYGAFNEPTSEDIGSARACRYELDRQGSQLEGLRIATAIRESTGVSQAVDRGMGLRTTEANGRQLAQIPSSGGCTVAIGVTDASRVDIVISTTAETESACEIADELAAVVEPKLPKG
ncbi:DUF3558 domain-containing protein [Saccharomonospora iraqiensis]|uniref:DUF3558 domain-containing protein n=1 Tax=Saccharomonospora iraqiensis TaxID=52698 RepID=UPI000A059B3A|nr:DUF3558 domain-containing protein [Saccharomonospora iraqiensis]